MGEMLDILLLDFISIFKKKSKSKKQISQNVQEAVAFIRTQQKLGYPIVFLKVMMLTRIYFYDDQVLDTTERKKLFELIKNYRYQLNTKDYNHLQHTPLFIWSLEDIKNFVDLHHISEVDLKSLLQEIYEMINNHPVYNDPFNELNRDLIQE